MNLDNYPGAKSGSGIQQWLINHIPAHDEYYELCAGSARLFAAKAPAKLSVLADIDEKTLEGLKLMFDTRSNLRFSNACVCDMLEYIRALSAVFNLGDVKRFIYLDPPYPESSRRSGKSYYRHEMLSDAEHEVLLQKALALSDYVMISTRQNDLYSQVLKDWRKDTFNTVDRVGAYEEVIYMNYDIPSILHQYNYVGQGYIDRQRIKRKISRFSDRLNDLPDYERHLFIQELIKHDSAAVQHFLTSPHTLLP